ncbi:MAG: vitamin B12-dependent ribonucleotide reductase, partial [Pseudomonadota bacterium]
ATFDDLGRGEEEGVSNVKSPSEAGALKGVEVLKQMVSTGYHRNRVPQEFVVYQGGAGATAFSEGLDPATALQTLVPETRVNVAPESRTMALHETPQMDASIKAKMQGYEGDPCGECGNYTLVRNGTCMKCNTCGSTTGCS